MDVHQSRGQRKFRCSDVLYDHTARVQRKRRPQIQGPAQVPVPVPAMSSNPGSSSSSSSGAASMSGSRPSSVAPEAKPETCDTKDQIGKMVQKETKIAEALREHPDAVWCGPSQDAPHMRNNIQTLFEASIRHQNQDPENTFQCSEGFSFFNVLVQKPLPDPLFCMDLSPPKKYRNSYQMQIETNSYPKEDGDGISVISVENIIHRKLPQKTTITSTKITGTPLEFGEKT